MGLGLAVGLSALFAALAGGTGAIWNATGSGRRDFDHSRVADKLSPEAAAAWNSLTDFQKQTIASQFYKEDNDERNLWGLFGQDRYTVNENRLLAALEETPGMLEAMGTLPENPDPDKYFKDAESRANLERDAALGELDTLRQFQTDNFNNELSNLAGGYNTSRSAILSNQYAQNAQLTDAMMSQMERSTRNALEAGASAGLRLAGNINTILSTQNKQSQTSLDTANQLAQMMVNQRNAEASVRGRYGEYMSQDFATRQGIKDSAYSNAQKYFDTSYNIAKDSYDRKVSDWDSKYGSNPMWEYRNQFSKSNYNKTGG